MFMTSRFYSTNATLQSFVEFLSATGIDNPILIVYELDFSVITV